MDNQYQEKFNEYTHNMFNIMFVFEVTKCCGYSTFITIYKNQSLIDLYSIIMNHFGNIEIKELYFVSTEQQRINIPLSRQSVSEFVSLYVLCNPIRLAPIYPLPKPTIYRLFLNDGHCTQQHTLTNTSL
jgi:hypothetical protein